MATIRGNDGEVTVGGNVIASISSFEITAERQLLEDTAMKDTGRSFKGGLPNWTARITARFRPDDTLGQQAIVTHLTQAAAPSNLALVFLADTGQTYTGSAMGSRFTHRQEIDGIAEIDFEVQGVGALVPSFS